MPWSGGRSKCPGFWGRKAPPRVSDWVLALRALYAAGALHEVGHTRLEGRTLTALEVTSPKPVRISSQRVLLDPKTGAPVELITHYGRQLGGLATTTIFHTYERLKLTAQTKRLLRFKAHPHAHLECVLALHCTHRESHGVDIGST